MDVSAIGAHETGARRIGPIKIQKGRRSSVKLSLPVEEVIVLTDEAQKWSASYGAWFWFRL